MDFRLTKKQVMFQSKADTSTPVVSDVLYDECTYDEIISFPATFGGPL